MYQMIKDIKSMVGELIKNMNAVGCPIELEKPKQCICEGMSKNLSALPRSIQMWTCPTHGHMTITSYRLKSDDLAEDIKRYKKQIKDQDIMLTNLKDKLTISESANQTLAHFQTRSRDQIDTTCKRNIDLEENLLIVETTRDHLSEEGDMLKEKLKKLEKIHGAPGALQRYVEISEFDRLMKLDAENDALKKQIELMGLEKIGFTQSNSELAVKLQYQIDDNHSLHRETQRLHDDNTVIRKTNARQSIRIQDLMALKDITSLKMLQTENAELKKKIELMDLIEMGQTHGNLELSNRVINLNEENTSFSKENLDLNTEINKLNQKLSDKENQSQVVDDINLKQLDKIKELEKGLKKCTDCFNRKINYDLKEEVYRLKKGSTEGNYGELYRTLCVERTIAIENVTNLKNENNSLGDQLFISNKEIERLKEGLHKVCRAKQCEINIENRDLKVEIEELYKRIPIAKEYYNLSGAIVVDGPQPECNCKEKYNKLSNQVVPDYTAWMCKVHGYKKL